LTERSEPLVLINLFSMPPEMVDGFVANWEANITAARGANGFRGTRLHRAIDPDAQYPVVNIARWDSLEDWEATVRRHFVETDRSPGASYQGPQSGSGPVSAHPNLYRVVHVTPDPQDAIGNSTIAQAQSEQG
jgi:heme-degrading monooxygenase HmoA